MIVSEIERSQTERIGVSLEQFRGHRFIDCRIFWKDNTGEWKPSKKGISLNDETVKEVIAALSKADHELKKQAGKRYAK